ncbi:hypothetical protein A6A04_19260 [Paramagnetospirillum marisnigri]|uniref:Uncharacterized protein n=1 Tax=Paramagnetospirillum marisnigri TaxID=1285242 RepID=A0A178MN17_9PROT|nr:YkgJ family cysteine cluster protein [Paramagnetospirillum marisnigri]OAN49488.1 hypothetical protein A6A04_19260 [Paramagnetospirillum marisnigri]
MSAAPGFSDARRAARQAAATALAEGGKPAAAARAAIAATDSFFQTLRQFMPLDAMLARLACAAGCSWCCRQMVGVTEAELALLGEAVAALPPERRDAIRRRAVDTIRRARGLDMAGWWAAQIPCPLLDEDGLCAVHQNRPLPCRGYNSADADICRRSAAGESLKAPVLAAQHGVWGQTQGGLAEALAAAGHAPGLRLLAEGVERLFTSPAGP